MRKRTAIEHGCQHAEAYCIMIYRCDECSKIEWLWNSRDGVTPFIITSLCCGKPQTHSNFSRDQYSPGYMPRAGQRVFVDQTPEGYREAWRKNVERNWEHPKYPMSASFSSKTDAVNKLANDFKIGQPTIRVSDGNGGYLP